MKTICYSTQGQSCSVSMLRWSFSRGWFLASKSNTFEFRCYSHSFWKAKLTFLILNLENNPGQSRYTNMSQNHSFLKNIRYLNRDGNYPWVQCSAMQCSAEQLVSLKVASVSLWSIFPMWWRAGGNVRDTLYRAMIWSWPLPTPPLSWPYTYRHNHTWSFVVLMFSTATAVDDLRISKNNISLSICSRTWKIVFRV